MGDEDIKLKITYKKMIYLMICVGIISIFTGGNYGNPDENTLKDVKDVLKLYYVDDLPDSIYNNTSISDILNQINSTDPYTKYYSATKYSEVVKSIDNDTSGLGIYLEMNSEGAKVTSINEITPEREAGLMVGDVILMADKHLLLGITKDAALRYIKGTDGGIVTLKIRRGTSLMIIDVNRRHTANYAIETKILDKHIGYIKINSFSQYGDSQFSYIINDYEKKKLDRYIIDLRYNSGGILKTAADISGYFVGANVAIITRSKHTPEYKYYGKFHGTIINKPIIFLVNKQSKSAAEALTAAVKDYKKAYIIGTQTFGKGSVQWPARLSNSDVLSLTIQRFFSPKGNPIDKVGVTPDLVVNDDVDALNIAELIMDSQQQLSNKTGCLQLCYDDKIVVINNTKASSAEYWSAYNALIERAKVNGSISFWDGKKWAVMKDLNTATLEQLYYHNYNIYSGVNAIDANKGINIKFNYKILARSINSKNIELIDALTGKRIKVNFKPSDNNDITIEPVADLQRDYDYLLVVNPGLLKNDNNPIGKGTVMKIRTNV